MVQNIKGSEEYSKKFLLPFGFANLWYHFWGVSFQKYFTHIHEYNCVRMYI